MKKDLFIIIILLLVCSESRSQELLWQKSYYPNPGCRSYTWLFTKTLYGNFILDGEVTLSYGSDGFILSIDKDGNILWNKPIYSSYVISHFPDYITQNKDSSYTFCSTRYIVVDYPDESRMFRYDLSPKGDSLNMVAIKMDSTGQTIWGSPYFYKKDDNTFFYSLSQYRGSMSKFEGIFFVTTDSLCKLKNKYKLDDDSLVYKSISQPKKDWDGNLVFITNKRGENLTNYVIIKTDDNGQKLSQDTVKSSYKNDYNTIYPTHDSCYVIISQNNSVLSKLDKNLKILWQTPLQKDTTYTNLCDLSETPDGGFICAGTTELVNRKIGRIDKSTTKCWVVKVGKSGNIVWDTKLGKDGVYNYFTHIVSCEDNTYLIAGNLEGASTIFKIKDNNVSAVSESSNPSIKMLSVHPNPAQDLITVETLSVSKIIIYNVFGTKVLESSDCINIDVSSLIPGLYFIKSGNQSCKFVKY